MSAPVAEYHNILVVVPNWVGDVVLASPVLAALRKHFERSHITYLMKPYVREVVAGCGWHDHDRYWPTGRGLVRETRVFSLANQLRRDRYDLALLLTNSFRSALTVRLAGAEKRVGYDRDARGWLLTDRLLPLKREGKFVPASVLPYYCKIAETVGCRVTDRKLRLGVAPEQERAGAALLQHYGLDDGRPYAVLNPGAAFGASKCWPAERFAAVADRLSAERDLRSVIVGGPNEIELMRFIAQNAQSDVICCADPGTTLGSLKVIMRNAALLVCNDTGPRHYGAAFDVPTVTIFGPTHQAWTDTDYDREVKIQIPVECGPCQLPKCPLDLRCMTGVTVDMVMHNVCDLLERTGVRAPRKTPAPA